MTEALNRIMPEEHPGQHALAARDISSNWNSQKGIMIRLFLLSNNFSLSDGWFADEIHDAQVSNVVEQIIPASSLSWQCFLSGQGFVSDAIKTKLFSWALRCGRDDFVRLLLRLGQSPNLDSTYATRRSTQPLQVAASIRDKRTSVKMIRTLLEHGANIDSSLVCSALNIAIAKDNQEAVDVLLEAGASLNMPSLAAAIWSGCDEIVRRVLDTGVDINENIPPAPFLWDINTWAALAHAAHRGHLQIVKTLVEKGADVDAVHPWSEFRGVWYEHLWTTALGIAVAADQAETVSFLAEITSEEIGERSAVDDYIRPLAIAVLTGNSEIITVLLGAGADVSRADEIPEKLQQRVWSEKWQRHVPKTLLEGLILQQEGDEETLVGLCEMLINKGARTDRALPLATAKERIEVVRLLLHHGATLDIPPGTKHLSSAFGLAIEMGNLTLARMLHDAGATETGILRNIQDQETAEFLDGLGLLDVALRKYGWLILNKAIEGGEESRWLVDRILRTAEIDFTGNCFCILATAVKHTLSIDFINMIISHGTAWTTWHISKALEAAIEAHASDDIIHLLLSAWRTANSEDYKIFILLPAAHRGSRQMLGIILAAFDWTPGDLGVALVHAISWKNYPIIQDLLNAGAAAAERYPSPLQVAVEQEQIWLVKMLLEAGADIQDDQALLLAVHCGSMSLVELLLSKGANPNKWLAPTKKMLTPLQLASSMGFLAIAKMLIDSGADINAPGKVVDDPSCDEYALELTALTVAALAGRLEILHLLLSRGAAVYGATRRQYIEAVRAANLRGHGAAATLLKSFGGWAEQDERICRAEHAAAVAAMRAHDKKFWDEYWLDKKGKTDDTTMATTDLAVREWPEGRENEWGVEGPADTCAHTNEFDDFFLEELARFQDYSVGGDGWINGF